jgi:hypothetical protein
MTRWIIASLAFLAIGWLNFRYGHVVALVTLVALLIFVAVFGGHGPRGQPGADTPPEAGGPPTSGDA